jgi:hypothetical protein
MTPDQIHQLLQLLGKIAERQFTITGAADWPILAWMCMGFGAMLGLMWIDLRSDRNERKEENEKEHDKLWHALRDCKEDCCPARKKV